MPFGVITGPNGKNTLAKRPTNCPKYTRHVPNACPSPGLPSSCRNLILDTGKQMEYFHNGSNHDVAVFTGMIMIACLTLPHSYCSIRCRVKCSRLDPPVDVRPYGGFR